MNEEDRIGDGVYSELFTTPENCDSTVLTLVTINPTAETFIEETICNREVFVLGTQELNQSGTYTEIFSTSLNCDSIVTLDLTVLPALITADAQGDKTIQLGEQTPILADFTNLDNLLTFSWTSSDSLAAICDTCIFQLVSPTETTTYSLIAEDVVGCSVVDNVTIQVEAFYDVYFPNAFSPNGDGINDFYYVHGTSNVSQVLTLDVYDRWGNQVFNNQNFSINNESEAWDGTFRQELTNAGVYVYIAQVQFADGNIQLFKGDITLIR